MSGTISAVVKIAFGIVAISSGLNFASCFIKLNDFDFSSVLPAARFSTVAFFKYFSGACCMFAIAFDTGLKIKVVKPKPAIPDAIDFDAAYIFSFFEVSGVENIETGLTKSEHKRVVPVATMA